MQVADRKVFTDSVIPLPAAPEITPHGLMVNLAKRDARDETMTILFSLAMPPAAKQDLEAKVASGETVPLDALRTTYAPSGDTVDSLLDWLEGQGFQILKRTADGTGVYASARVSQIARSLDVNMVPVTKDGITYTAAQNAPSLPIAIGAGVQAIIGLQPFRKAHKHRAARTFSNLNRATLINGVPSPNIVNRPPYLVPEILKAYNADALGVTGLGQTIAILIDTLPDDSDVAAFWLANGIAIKPDRIEKINVRGGVLPPPEGEETLDVEWSSGIAPGATIRVYATGSLNFVDIDMTLDRIIEDLPTQPGLRQLSMSLGLGETYLGGAGGEMAVQHQKFLQLAAAGVNVFVSSGDAGSNPDVTGHSSSGPTQVEYESSDPAVVAVGGTTLTLAPDGSVAAEVAWVAGGGGVSQIFPRQSWQVGRGVPSGNMRLVPDVSLAADPNEGAFLVLQGSPIGIGGTSWSAPVWAAFCALINEARRNAGLPMLPFLNPLIYPLQSTGCFRDITQGSNGAYQSGIGYDSVTGLGVPDVSSLIQFLARP